MTNSNFTPHTQNLVVEEPHQESASPLLGDATMMAARSEISIIRKEVLSRISHELRSPLTSIMGFAEILVNDHQVPQGQREEFELTIKVEAERLVRFLRTIHELYEIENGLAVLQRSPGDIAQTVKNAVALNSDQARLRAIAISIETPEHPVTGNFDGRKLATVVYQVLNNAIRYTRSGGSADVKVKRTEEGVVISILDSGVGISPRHLPLIFDKYFRIDRSGDGGAGLGIGLSVARNFVELHGGTITVTSAEGNGSRFDIFIPVLIRQG